MHKLLLVIVSLTALQPLMASEIRHRFLAVDESRAMLHYVAQGEPSKDWSIKWPVKHRDLQLVGKNVVMLSYPDGYHEFSLADQKLVKEVKGYPGATSARRLPDGRTILACNAKGAVKLYELGPDDKPIRQATFKVASTRVARLTPEGTVLFGSSNVLLEGDWKGTRKTVMLPQGSWAYQALRKPDGHLLVAGGYLPCLYEIDAEGHVLKTLGGKQSAEAQRLGFHFFGAFQVLKSGHIVICNWTGHGPNDSSKGVQLLQYNPAGQLAWQWHDPQRAGSINGVIVLDDLDPAVLNDDASSVLAPVK